MVENEKSTIVLIVQGTYRLFCYFNISPRTAKEFDDIYGESSWKSSKFIIKVYSVENGTSKELKSISIENLTNGCYIDMDRGDQDVFVELKRKLDDNKFETIAVSNTVNTPRNYESADTGLYFVNVSESFQSNLSTANNIDNNRGTKPYPFMNKEKEYIKYPKITIVSGYYQNDFFTEHFEKLKSKCDISSSKVR
ncbi:DUF4912 domain-containing protein [Clostridiaceae bacterium UIB06]|uniref:DUF4912 domain-containing protein n=1 Tax=Clostridium thailandense TaxID=2794346 RepID=A0A949TZC1_9CLOT|nr:DUF4912 domain-containing protein [Clostridium thailandense]MBV7275438.1 DUF4912 domain-containing protein [Clostridium thailandense]MCH5136701.1 DUF4912 domain-containing protein [Clostridiaceae bacterium UIB06]